MASLFEGPKIFFHLHTLSCASALDNSTNQLAGDALKRENGTAAGGSRAVFAAWGEPARPGFPLGETGKGRLEFPGEEGRTWHKMGLRDLSAREGEL